MDKSSTVGKQYHAFIAVSITTSFGNNSSPIYPKYIECSGDELLLSNCDFTEYDPKQCQQVAGVICEGILVLDLITL